MPIAWSNLAAKVTESVWPEFRACLKAAYQAPGIDIARGLAEGVVRDIERDCPSAIACFLDDFEACIAHQRMPVKHHRAVRTTNMLERLFVEERRRLKIIPNAFGEKAELKLMFAAMVRASDRWKPLRILEFEARQLERIRGELSSEYEATTGFADAKRRARPPAKVSSRTGTCPLNCFDIYYTIIRDGTRLMYRDLVGVAA